MTQYAEHGHLGGYIIGGDDATYCPELWDWLVEEQGVGSVLDVGCGEGHALDYFHRKDCLVLGVDGVPQEHLGIVTWDYTLGPYRPQETRYDYGPPLMDGTASWRCPRIVGMEFDLVWSCEFVEHVEERYVPNFLATFKHGKLVLMTHAEPGQPGYHHVNCRSGDYWVGVMAAIGYELDGYLTAKTRGLAPGTHYARSGLAFVASASRDTMPDERSDGGSTARG